MPFSNAVRVARGASYFIIQNLSTNAAMVVSFAVLARLITPKEMGIFAVLNLVNGICQVTSTLALPRAVTRFVAEEIYIGNRAAAASIFYQGLRTTLLLATPIGALVFLAAKTLSSLLLSEDIHLILFQFLAFDIVLFAGALPVLTATLLGLQKFKQMASVGIVTSFARQLLIIVLVIGTGNLLGLVIAWVVSDLVTATIYFIVVTRMLGLPKFDFSLRRLLTYSWPLSISNGVSFASAWFDRAVLVTFVPLAILGVYNATIIAFNVLVDTSGAIAGTLFPAYSAMQPVTGRETLRNSVRLASRYVTITVVPLALGLLATSKVAVRLFVGESYSEGSAALMVLAGTFALTQIATTLTPMLLALRETRVVSAITSISVVLGLLALLLLGPLWGIVGAAIARGIAMIVEMALTSFVTKRKLGSRLDFEAMTKSLFAGILMTIAVIAIQIPLQGKFWFPIYVLVGAITYLIALRLLKVVRRDDIDLMRNYLGIRLGWVSTIIGRILL